MGNASTRQEAERTATCQNLPGDSRLQPRDPKCPGVALSMLRSPGLSRTPANASLLKATSKELADNLLPRARELDRGHGPGIRIAAWHLLHGPLWAHPHLDPGSALTHREELPLLSHPMAILGQDSDVLPPPWAQEPEQYSLP